MKTLYVILVISFALIVGCSEVTNKNKMSDNEVINDKSGEVSIEGMSCMACVAKVKKNLSDTEGINEVAVSLENKNATFQYHPNKISLDEIVQAIDDIGYEGSTEKELPE